MTVGTTNLVTVKSGKSLENNILMNNWVTFLVIVQIATTDIQKNASTKKCAKDSSLIHVSFYIQ